MPRGSHKGGIFPVSGLPWGMNRPYLKRGLYQHRRDHIFTPRWGTRTANFNPSPLPDGGTRKWENDAFKAWPLNGVPHHVKLYAVNEARYLVPAARCTAGPEVTQYILNQLDPGGAGRTFSGIGRPDVRLALAKPAAPSTTHLPRHLVNVARHVMGEAGERARRKNLSYSSSLSEEGFSPDVFDPFGTPMQERSRIKRLYNLVCEADSWRVKAEVRGGGRASSSSDSINAFPYVDEKAALVRDLPLAEILYSRHSHRLQSRRHPFWVDNGYKKRRVRIPYLYRRRVAKEEAQAREFGLSRTQGSQISGV
ncbi:hypothetical protein BESB_073620 [Besnoitia besnoiti]|uniref:Uncharacterized protein n=1 Tax=Besnoitia besnoiti TaxID=94643 RepID=A0A2A9MFQ3_BESBE|nr:uncharacterized protein BESB_073620 [Besnoitia besnoiti]PFH34210.1 hypothetical protein BESB_073620 [Besnoitia besnoiti]